MTGLSAPSLQCVRRLQQELGNQLIVLVDAAQTRSRLTKIKDYVTHGAIVMISGSKFFTGSPFSGALLVPPRYFATLDTVRQVPDGFGAYLSSLEVPTRWRTLRAALPETPNLGLFMRWRTALAEMRAFQEVAENLKNTWYREFREAVVAACERYHLQLVDSPVGQRMPDPTDAWDTQPTIFTFLVRIGRDDGSRPLATYEQASQIYVALNRDVSEDLPDSATDEERVVAATPCHIGQPVRVRSSDGSISGALRIAVGARYVSRLAFDASLGSDSEARKLSQLRDLDCTLHKIALLAHYWSETAPAAR
jgi:hypothetical protein